MSSGSFARSCAASTGPCPGGTADRHATPGIIDIGLEQEKVNVLLDGNQR